MTSNTARVSATAFFQSYAAAFEHADASAILDHFAFPCHITSEAQEITLTAIASREEGARLVEQLLEMYRNVGVATARVLELGVNEISPRLLVALVHWGLDDEAGARVYAFEAAYTLASIDGVLRISTVAHNEIPQYRAALARISS